MIPLKAAARQVAGKSGHCLELQNVDMLLPLPRAFPSKLPRLVVPEGGHWTTNPLHPRGRLQLCVVLLDLVGLAHVAARCLQEPFSQTLGDNPSACIGEPRG